MTAHSIWMVLLVVAACDGPREIGSRSGALEEAAEVETWQVVPTPGAEETWEGLPAEPGWAGEPDDLDRDGTPSAVDVDDLDDAVGSAEREIPCDGVDQDGDLFDLCEADVDGDGASSRQDCDDLDRSIGPLQTETRCNGEDENCDGLDDCDTDDDGVLDRNDPDPDDPRIVPPEVSERAGD